MNSTSPDPRRSGRNRNKKMTVNTEAAAVSSNGSAVPRRSGRNRNRTMTVNTEAPAVSSTRPKTAASSANKSKRKRGGGMKGDPGKKQKKNRDAEMQYGQVICLLAEKSDLDIIIVHPYADKKGKKWPCIVIANAPEIIKLIKKMNRDLNPDSYGGSGRSKEGTLKKLLMRLGFWEVKSISLEDFEVTAPRGNKWKMMVCHPELEKFVDGKFDKDKVALITSRYVNNKPNPFENDNKKPKQSKKSKGEIHQATIRFGTGDSAPQIHLKTGLTKEAAQNLHKRGKDFVSKMQKSNPDVEYDEVVEALVKAGIKSRRLHWGAMPGGAGSKKKAAPKKKAAAAPKKKD